MTQREYDEKHNRLSRLIQDANRKGWKDVQIRAVRALQKLCAENPNRYHEHYAAIREGRAWVRI